MGDISQGLEHHGGYMSPEDRRLSALEADVADLRAEVDRLRRAPGPRRRPIGA